MMPTVQRTLALLLAPGSVSAGLFIAMNFAAVRSDFRLRACHELPKEDWIYSANCLDGAWAMRVLGLGVLISGVLFVWSVWRLRHV